MMLQTRLSQAPAVPIAQANINKFQFAAPATAAFKRKATLVPHALRCATPVLAAAAGAMGTVKITIQGRHMEVTPSMKEFAESKVYKAVHNFEGSVKQVDVKLSARGNHGKGSEAHHQREQTAEITVYTMRHGVIRVEDTENDLYAALDLVSDKLKRKMAKLKEKAVQRNTWPGRGGTKGGQHIEDHLDVEEVAELPTGEVAAPPPPEIVREKVLLLETTMTAEEAVEHLEAVGHDFFVYLDKEDRSMKVVYRRRNHGYGLLIPRVSQ